MVSVNIEIDDRKVREAFKRFPDRSRANFRRALETAGSMVERDAKRAAPVDQGSLRQSITTRMDGMTAIVEETTGYGKYVEFGRRPGTPPPIDRIERWAERRGIEPFVIARHIGRFGTKAQPFMEPSFQNNLRNIEYQMQSALRRTLGEL